MKFSLIVVSNASPAKEIPIRMPEFVIGRDPECHLRPASAMISKKHCAFILQGERVLFKDFGSTNGSYVNDLRIEGETALKHGDIVKFGPLTFRAKIETTAAAMAALPSVPAASSAPTVVPSSDKTILETPAFKATTSSSQTVKRASAAEDDIAAMLFNFADAPTSTVPSDEIPMGSTVAAMTLDTTPAEEMPALTDVERRTVERKKSDAAKKASNSANTSSAAEAILQKYMRRPR